MLAALVDAAPGTGFVEVRSIARAARLDHASVQLGLSGLASHGDLFFRSVLDTDGRTFVYVSHVTAYARQTAAHDLLRPSNDFGLSAGKPARGRHAIRAIKIVSAVVGAAAAKVIATLILDSVHRP
ncbi:hypothetical protein [Micromonospora sp. NPDC049171]|uniref:hypothetical protein n=1 Tax=Micromonospora sp. NPDC049171 TaxID=3155770 RepID=UPI0033DBF41A